MVLVAVGLQIHRATRKNARSRGVPVQVIFGNAEVSRTHAGRSARNSNPRLLGIHLRNVPFGVGGLDSNRRTPEPRPRPTPSRDEVATRPLRFKGEGSCREPSPQTGLRR